MINRTTLHVALMVSIVFLASTLFFAVLFGRVHAYAFWMGGVITFLFVHYWRRRVGTRTREAFSWARSEIASRVRTSHTEDEK